MNSLFDLNGKVAIITGASGGIGAEITKAFAAQGADVAVLDIRYEWLEALVGEIESMGRKVLPIKCDVAEEEEIKAAVKTVLDTFGKIDILVNNAGVASGGSLEDIEEAEWDRVIDINLKGTFLMSKHVVAHMKERKYGKIVNTASVCGRIGSKSASLHAYGASKGAVINLTRTMGASLAPYGITVNAIGPALFKTKMTENSLCNERFLEGYNALCPVGRPGSLEELNGAAIYFASDASSYTTGQTLFIDGGLTAV